MKHEGLVTLILVIVFALSQLGGLYLVGESMEISCEQVDNQEKCLVTFSDTAIGERPETQGAGSVLYMVLGVGLGTVFLLIIARLGKATLWKAWFFIAVWLTISIALEVLIDKPYVAWALAFALTAWKLWRPNIFVYNFAEILMYAGIAVLLVPIFYVPNQSNEAMSVWPILLILGLVSIYDMIAVWKSGHMVTMATFITSTNAFAGLMVPYNTEKKSILMNMPHKKKEEKETVEKSATKKKSSHIMSESEKSSPIKNAILGGGDITFPLLFAGAIMYARTMEAVKAGLPFVDGLTSAFFAALIISAGATLAIGLLFVFAKKDRFYPAMPFVTAGCMLGWAVSFLVS